VAIAAKHVGTQATIVMPEDAPHSKLEATRACGATIVTYNRFTESRELIAQEILEQSGGTLVPPFDHPMIMAGQGTAALELLEDAGPLDRFYAPISGGGLMAGCAVAIHALQPGVELVGVEPEDAGDTRLSFAAGERRKIPPPYTIADGLRVRTPGALSWPVLRRHVARVELVSDEELLDAMGFALRELRVALEPSGAASLALALREGRGRCGVLLSGGNAEPALLAEAARRAAR